MFFGFGLVKRVGSLSFLSDGIDSTGKEKRDIAREENVMLFFVILLFLMIVSFSLCAF
jgi:hypothetical protein